MASTYGLNFGFRRSDESYRSSEGRVKTPATGPSLLIGTPVEIDPASPGYLKACASGAKPRPGTCGLLVQEEFDFSIYESDIFDSFTRGVAKKDRLSVITSGASVKVWYQNTGASTRADGRGITAVTMFATASVAVGHGLAWDGVKFINVTDPTDATSFGEVTYYDSAKQYVELVLSH